MTTLSVRGDVVVREVEFPYFARIDPDYIRTSDHRPRTAGANPTTVASVDYRNMMNTGPMGAPDQVNLFDDLWIRLEKPHQLLWMDLNCLAIYGKRWSQLVGTERQQALTMWRYIAKGNRCFTNGSGWDNARADFIQKINLTELPIEQEQVVCSLNLVKVIGKVVTFSSNYLGLGSHPYPHVPIECVDPKKPLHDAEDLLNIPWLCHKPSNSTGKYLGNGVYEIIPFNYDNRYVLWGKNGVGYIRTDWITKI